MFREKLNLNTSLYIAEPFPFYNELRIRAESKELKTGHRNPDRKV